MSTIKVNDLIGKAAVVAQDPTYIRWSQTEWLGWLNDAQREVVLYKPHACVQNKSVSLTVGKTKQSLPADGIMLIDVTRNMGAAGTTDGDAIRLTSREVLDAQNPNWHSAANSVGKILHYCFDSRDPKSFYVYPKAPSTAHFVEVVYAANPTDCVVGGAITIDDIYANALLNLMLYRAYSKDAEYAQNAQLASAYYQAATATLGIKDKVETEQNPNKVVLGNPNVVK